MQAELERLVQTRTEELRQAQAELVRHVLEHELLGPETQEAIAQQVATIRAAVTTHRPGGMTSIRATSRHSVSPSLPAVTSPPMTAPTRHASSSRARPTARASSTGSPTARCGRST